MNITGTKGFLFIEGSIMVIIAGVGIISAAVFPMMTGYMQRSRDTARISHISMYSTALSAYYSDNESYPDAVGKSCVPGSVLVKKGYMYSLSTDPNKRLTNPCDGTEDMTYAYRKFQSSDGGAHFAIAAKMENPNSGNSYKSIDGYTDAELSEIEDSLIRGSGPYYISIR